MPNPRPRGCPEGPGSKAPLPEECSGSPSFYGAEFEENLRLPFALVFNFWGPMLCSLWDLKFPNQGLNPQPPQ